jgi:hypothetical protein
LAGHGERLPTSWLFAKAAATMDRPEGPAVAVLDRCRAPFKPCGRETLLSVVYVMIVGRHWIQVQAPAPLPSNQEITQLKLVKASPTPVRDGWGCGGYPGSGWSNQPRRSLTENF